jgi:hypothetical protein
MSDITIAKNSDGTYTVNGPDSVGPENFSTFAEAATRLEQRTLATPDDASSELAFPAHAG